MLKKEIISNGVFHKVQGDLKKELISNKSVFLVWQSLTPLARNEWICWIESAKKTETKNRRLKITKENLLKGKRRPCCWVGCPHR